MTLRHRLSVVLALLALIWAIELINWALGHQLNRLGILPRSLQGLPGILLAPLLHTNFSHAIANSAPLLLLGWLTSIHGRARFIRVALGITVMTGAAVWLFARTAYHVGASGLVFGLFGYLLSRAWFERSFPALLSAAAAVLLYGGLVWGLLPAETVSFESHVFGLLAGLLMGRFERRR
ncbi:MAG: rhomboid family intramembrane serine protease [Pseudomonadota bacterium]